MERSPDVLRERAREIVQRMGYDGPWTDEASWLERDYGRLRWLADNVPSVEWRRGLADSGSPVPLQLRLSETDLTPASASGAVTGDDPSAQRPGEIRIAVTALGRVRGMLVVPARRVSERNDAAPFPEQEVFETAGLDPRRFEGAGRVGPAGAVRRAARMGRGEPRCSGRPAARRRRSATCAPDAATAAARSVWPASSAC